MEYFAHSGLRNSAINLRVFGTGLQNSHDKAEKTELCLVLWPGSNIYSPEHFCLCYGEELTRIYNIFLSWCATQQWFPSRKPDKVNRSPSVNTDNTYNTCIIIITFNITTSHRHHHKIPSDKKNCNFNPVRSPPQSCCQLMDNINKQRQKTPTHFFVFYIKIRSCFLPVKPCREVQLSLEKLRPLL